MVEYAKETYAVPFSKKGAQELLVCLYTHAGEAVKTSLDDNTLKAMDGTFKSIKPLNEDQKKPKVDFMGEAASESQIIPPKRETIKQDNKPRDLSNEVIKALPLMNDNANWQKRK